MKPVIKKVLILIVIGIIFLSVLLLPLLKHFLINSRGTVIDQTDLYYSNQLDLIVPKTAIVFFPKSIHPNNYSSLSFLYIDNSFKDWLVESSHYGNTFVLEIQFNKESFYQQYKEFCSTYPVDSFSPNKAFEEGLYKIYDITQFTDEANKKDSMWICFSEVLNKIRYIYIEEEDRRRIEIDFANDFWNK